MEDGSTAMASEVFALTDEQIVGLGPAEVASGGRPFAGAQGKRVASEEEENSTAETQRSTEVRGELEKKDNASIGDGEHGARGSAPTVNEPRMSPDSKPPQWLAERMKDPWTGEEAREFWEGAQRAEREAAAFREVFGTPEEARGLKEIYPGGLTEAKAAAERARTLDEMDAAFYRGDARARMELAQRMMAQDAGAFREMVEAGLKLLGKAGNNQGREVASGEWPFAGAQGKRVASEERGLAREGQVALNDVRESVPTEVVRAYGEFEKSANLELEKSVGGAIARAMESALPNLSQVGTAGRDGAQHAAPLRERLSGAVREEIEAGLKSDRQLGEQVARLLAGRRFDGEARAQVVRLIDARAQQLLPGAMRRVVSAWTQTTLAAHGKEKGGERTEARKTSVPADGLRSAARERSTRKETVKLLEEPAGRRGRRVDYGRWSDEEIVGL